MVGGGDRPRGQSRRVVTPPKLELVCGAAQRALTQSRFVERLGPFAALTAPFTTFVFPWFSFMRWCRR